MSISKSYNKATGVTYVYEVYENYWDKEKKIQVQKRRCIGKIDPVTGDIIPTRKKKAEEPAPSPASTAPLSSSVDFRSDLDQEALFLESLIQTLQSQKDTLSLQIDKASDRLKTINSLKQNLS